MKIKVYEFCGYINTPNECSGEWYEDFPYLVDGSKIEPRTTYMNVAQGCRMSQNWRAYVMTSEPVRKYEWVGDWPKGADMIVSCPIQEFSFITRVIPTLEIHAGNWIHLHEGILNRVVEPHTKFVPEFQTKDGKRVVSLWKNEKSSRA